MAGDGFPFLSSSCFSSNQPANSPFSFSSSSPFSFTPQPINQTCSSLFSPPFTGTTCAPTTDSTARVKVKASSKCKNTSASSNGGADVTHKIFQPIAESPSLEQTSNEVVSKPAVEEANSEVPSLEQNKPLGKSESMVEGLQPKTSENNGEWMVVEPCETFNGGPHVPPGESPKGVETEEAKNKSTSLPAEGTSKSDKFSYTRILRGITHDPHFRPLESYSKRSREKFIVGWDEIFEETIDQIQSLTTKTFSTDVQELWKTIAELENLGYNVGRLRKRLDELADMMNKRNSSEIDASHLRAKADDYKKERKKIEKDIADLQAQADKAQVMVDELVDQADKMELNIPTVDMLFENIAKNPL